MNNPYADRRRAVRDAAAYTDNAIKTALNGADDEVVQTRSSSSEDTPELSTLSVEFENDNGKFGYNESTLYGKIIKTEDGNIRVQVKARISSELELAELNLQVSLID